MDTRTESGKPEAPKHKWGQWSVGEAYGQKKGRQGKQTTMFTSFITNGSIFSHGLHHTHDLDELQIEAIPSVPSAPPSSGEILGSCGKGGYAESQMKSPTPRRAWKWNLEKGAL